jgi:tripartite-type tricarboxylate transporter receptor subunit TctC
MRRTFGLAALGVAATLAFAPLHAQTYPNKPIHVIVPVPAGALTDVLARKIASVASAKMGQPWIMENKPGANFIPAAENCRRATPDGYTLCVFTTSTLTFNPVLIDNLPYDPDTDFVPIINLGMLIGGLVASPKLDVKNIDDLRKLALSKPGQLNFGTYGPGSSANVFREYMNKQWGTNVVEVGYKGSNELLAALVAGEIHMTWTALGSWADNPGNSKGIVMVADSLKRSPRMPNVPLYEEVGLTNYPIHTWMGLFAPKGLPPALADQINKVVGEAINDPSVTEFLVNQVVEPRVTDVKGFVAQIAGEKGETAKILTGLNIPKIK